jgi:peptide/nickel transport system permease protein
LRLPLKLVAGACLVGLIFAAGLLAPLVAPHDPLQQDLLNRLASPSADHWLGTDSLGRDTFSRLLYAARVDIPIGVLTALLPMLIGSVLGGVGAFYGRALDSGVVVLANLVQAFPTYVFLLALVFALGPGVYSILIAFAVLGWVPYARLMRAEVLRLRSRDFVQAALAGGLPSGRVLARHVLPNALRQTLVYLAADIATAILVLTALSFLGVGIPAPTPEWGAMINEGQQYLRNQWWLSVVPGFVVMLVGVGFSLIGDGLDELLLS